MGGRADYLISQYRGAAHVWPFEGKYGKGLAKVRQSAPLATHQSKQWLQVLEYHRTTPFIVWLLNITDPHVWGRVGGWAPILIQLASAF